MYIYSRLQQTINLCIVKQFFPQPRSTVHVFILCRSLFSRMTNVSFSSFLDRSAFPKCDSGKQI